MMILMLVLKALRTACVCVYRIGRRAETVLMCQFPHQTNVRKVRFPETISSQVTVLECATHAFDQSRLRDCVRHQLFYIQVCWKCFRRGRGRVNPENTDGW